MRMNCSSDRSSYKSKCFKIALMAIAGIALLGWIVMLLWNWLMPAVFTGAQPVDYLQALGILLLSKILFGGFRGGFHERLTERRQRWENMTPEERAQIKAHFKSRWGNWCSSDKRDDNSSTTHESRGD